MCKRGAGPAPRAPPRVEDGGPGHNSPRPLAALRALQMYTIACHELVGRDPPGRRALCSFLAACDSPVALLQHRFLCVSQRVCQVGGPCFH